MEFVSSFLIWTTITLELSFSFYYFRYRRKYEHHEIIIIVIIGRKWKYLNSNRYEKLCILSFFTSPLECVSNIPGIHTGGTLCSLTFNSSIKYNLNHNIYSIRTKDLTVLCYSKIVHRTQNLCSVRLFIFAINIYDKW